MHKDKEEYSKFVLCTQTSRRHEFFRKNFEKNVFFIFLICQKKNVGKGDK